MFQDLHKIRQFLCDASDGGEYLVQKYLERPLLLWGRKFDIRCWALLTDAFDLYVYRDGYLRTSSEPFTLELGDENNMVRGPPHNRVAGTPYNVWRGGLIPLLLLGVVAGQVHLTNYCMQKHSENLGRYEEGNTLSYDDLQAYLDEHFPAMSVNVREHILTRIKDVIRDTILAVRQKLCRKHRCQS